MSVYYKIACDEVREHICPGDINDGGMKEYSISSPLSAFGPVAVFAMWNRWEGKPCRIVSDSGEAIAYDDYTDVTKAVLDDYNEYYEKHLKASPPHAEPGLTMRLEDVAKWHRVQEKACRQSAQVAQKGYERGCEDAAVAAHGWNELAFYHARMAEAIEDCMNAPSLIPALDLSDRS